MAGAVTASLCLPFPRIDTGASCWLQPRSSLLPFPHTPPTLSLSLFLSLPTPCRSGSPHLASPSPFLASLPEALFSPIILEHLLGAPGRGRFSPTHPRGALCRLPGFSCPSSPTVPLPSVASSRAQPPLPLPWLGGWTAAVTADR